MLSNRWSFKATKDKLPQTRLIMANTNGRDNETETIPECGNQGRLKEGGRISLVVFLLVEETC